MTSLLTAENIGRAVFVTAIVVAAVWTDRVVSGRVETEVKTDTTYTERVITKRDTVTETRPVTRTIYERDTTIKRDTTYIRKPSTFTPQSCVGQHPLDIDGRNAVLTRWDLGEQRWVQDTYRFERPDWRITAGGDLTAGTTFAHGRSTIDLGHRTPVGWIHLGAGYGGVVTDEIHAGIIGKVGIRKTLYSW